MMVSIEKKKQWKFIGKVIFMIFMVFVVMNGCFNYVMEQYTKTKAKKLLAEQMQQVKNGEKLGEILLPMEVIYLLQNEQLEYDFFESVTSNTVSFDNAILEYRGMTTRIKSGVADYVIEYIKNFGVQDEIQTIEVNHKEYYAGSVELGVDLQKEYNASKMVLIVSTDKMDTLIQRVGIWFTVSSALVCIFFSMGVLMLQKKNDVDKGRLKSYFENASHELKTPIMNIEGYAEGIYTGVVENDEEAAQIIMEESERMKRLVNEILCLSKMESGQLQMNWSAVDVKELLYFCMEEVKKECEKKEICLKLEAERILEIQGDEKWLERTFCNILQNAIRYAKKNILMSLKCSKKHIVVEIRDDGDGIAQEDLPYIFERFYVGKGGNTGLGLALAKQVVLLHGGKITVENNNGAIFRIIFPKK